MKDKTRFKVLACGRRWGKTKMCAYIAVKAASEGKRVWWVAPTYSIAQLGMREARYLASQIPGTVAKYGAMTLLVPPDDGFIMFKSSEIPDNLRGEGLDLLIMDEADFQHESVWTEVLRPALADKKGSAIFISTPNVEGGWFHKLWLLGQSGKDPEVKSWQFSSYTNPFIDPREIDRAKSELPSITFRREFLAEFVSSTGARIKRDWLKYEDRAPTRIDGMKIAIGIDLAISERDSADWTAAAVLGRDADGVVHVLDVQRIKASFHEQQKFIKILADRWKPDILGIEDVAYQRSMIQEISASTSLHVVGIKPDKDKVSRFAPLEARYELGQVVHLRDLPSAFENELLSFPAGEHDDQIDAMSIAWSALSELKEKPTFTIPARAIKR